MVSRVDRNVLVTIICQKILPGRLTTCTLTCKYSCSSPCQGYVGNRSWSSFIIPQAIYLLRTWHDFRKSSGMCLVESETITTKAMKIT